MAEQYMPTCDKPVGSKPSWMSEEQFEVDHCVCLREPGHKPPCACEHTMVPDEPEIKTYQGLADEHPPLRARPRTQY